MAKLIYRKAHECPEKLLARLKWKRENPIRLVLGRKFWDDIENRCKVLTGALHASLLFNLAALILVIVVLLSRR